MKTRFHLLLHVGCVALLLLQGYRIQQLRVQAAHPSQTLLSSDQQVVETYLRRQVIKDLLIMTHGSPGDTLDDIYTFWKNGEECFEGPYVAPDHTQMRVAVCPDEIKITPRF
jgi:hypothetical protein